MVVREVDINVLDTYKGHANIDVRPFAFASS